MTTMQTFMEVESEAVEDVERGSFAPTGAHAPAKSRVVIATYNIRYAVGSFLISGGILRRAGLSRPRRRQSLVAGNIVKAARLFADGTRMPPPDIIALQEADSGTVRAGGHDVARELAQALRTHYARAAMRVPQDSQPKPKQWYLDFEEPLRVGEEGDTGVAILSRLPFARVARLELPWSECAWRPHLALVAKFSVGGRQLHLFNAHIDPHTGTEGRLAQHEAILERVSRLSAEEPAILLGDYNTLRAASREATRRLLEAHGFASPLPTGEATWRAGLLRLHTDWIFVRGVRVTGWGVARFRGVSDHWPVWVEIEMKETGAA